MSFNYPTLPEQAELLRARLRQLAASGDLDALLRYQPHGGRAHVRAIMARHLARSGLSVEPEHVLIVGGAQHGLAAALALLRPGDEVAVDALTYPGFKTLAEQFRLELVPVPAAGAGMDLDALERLCRQRTVRALYTMPTVHNPLGWVLDLSARQRLVTLAQRYGLILIEDAPYAFLEPDPPPMPAAQAHWIPAGADDPRHGVEYAGDDDRDRLLLAGRRHGRPDGTGEAPWLRWPARPSQPRR